MESTQPAHLFVIDPIESLNPTLDSSLRMMYGLARRGHHIQVCQAKDLSIESTSKGSSKGQGEGTLAITRVAKAQTLTFKDNSTYKLLEFALSPVKTCPLKDYQAIHMRKDPPFDLDYITTTWLLDDLPVSTKVYNRPEALRRHNEKILITLFPQHITPILVSANPEALLDFIEVHKDIVLKPLNLFGGRGVLRLSLHTQKIQDIKKIILAETSQGLSLRLAQPFNQKIVDGEIRVFSAFGKPLAWCLKKPKSGEFLANTRAGATLHNVVPSDSLYKSICDVSRELLPQGISLIGFDVIGDKISEINITSPRLLLPPDTVQEHIYEELAMMFASNLT